MKVVISGYVGKKLTGIGRDLVNLLDNSKSNNQYIIYTNIDQKDNYKFTNPNVVVKTYKVSKMSSLKNLLWTTFVFPLIVKKENADIGLIPNFTLLLFKLRPTVVFIHDLIEFNVPGKFSRLKMFYRTKLADPITARRADKIRTISENSKNDIIKFLGVSENKITVLICGLDQKKFHKMDDETTIRILRQKGWPEDYLLYSGIIEHPGKNTIGVIKAFENLKDSGRYNGSLIIAGMPGSGFDIVQEYVNNSKYKDQIIFSGYVTDEELVALYSRCATFVFVSLYEGFGFPPLEAMACGAKVVVSNTSSLPEVVGDLGIKVDPTDQEAITNAVYESLKWDATQDYYTRVEEHLKNFDLEYLSTRFEEWLQSAIILQ